MSNPAPGTTTPPTPVPATGAGAPAPGSPTQIPDPANTDFNKLLTTSEEAVAVLKSLKTELTHVKTSVGEVKTSLGEVKTAVGENTVATREGTTATIASQRAIGTEIVTELQGVKAGTDGAAASLKALDKSTKRLPLGGIIFLALLVILIITVCVFGSMKPRVTISGDPAAPQHVVVDINVKGNTVEPPTAPLLEKSGSTPGSPTTATKPVTPTSAATLNDMVILLHENNKDLVTILEPTKKGSSEVTSTPPALSLAPGAPILTIPPAPKLVPIIRLKKVLSFNSDGCASTVFTAQDSTIKLASGPEILTRFVNDKGEEQSIKARCILADTDYVQGVEKWSQIIDLDHRDATTGEGLILKNKARSYEIFTDGLTRKTYYVSDFTGDLEYKVYPGNVWKKPLP
ncbi:TPA: hypothetical protein DCQ44_02425 [Candidatus Taylorbacteria bacterium]|nr:hypothetical protein [Candidatus Taylorbacteria bacterium]